MQAIPYIEKKQAMVKYRECLRNKTANPIILSEFRELFPLVECKFDGRCKYKTESAFIFKGLTPTFCHAMQTAHSK